MRPLYVDEKLRVFIENEDDELFHYDGGEFYAWLKECEAGQADPTEGAPYPLLVQDHDLRVLLEIKMPMKRDGEEEKVEELSKKKRRGKNKEPVTIKVPTSRLLPRSEQPEVMLPKAGIGQVHKDWLGGGSSTPRDSQTGGVRPTSSNIPAGPAFVTSVLPRDPPYVRFVQPTPDDLYLSVEYDMDEEDEDWLAAFNKKEKDKAAKALKEEWFEHLMDKMEKEYTAVLLAHPEKWVVVARAADQPPQVTLPPIGQVFPLQACLKVPGIGHYGSTFIRSVYNYWKAKHQRAGRPLIQRLWYEPPWHLSSKRAVRLPGGGGDDEDIDSLAGPFRAHDSPDALAGIRRRKMEPAEVKSRFEGIRRDLETLRTLADQTRRRERLKRRELQLYAEEYESRIKAAIDKQQGLALLKNGNLKHRPPPLSFANAAQKKRKKGKGSENDAESEDVAQLIRDTKQWDEVVLPAEDRAARLAARREAREAAGAGMPLSHSHRRPGTPASNAYKPIRKMQRPASAALYNTTALERDTIPHPSSNNRNFSSAGRAQMPRSSIPVLCNEDGVRGPKPAPGIRRDAKCVWCGTNAPGVTLLGCSSCHRCYCFKCYQRRPGHGINNWSRAVRDSKYRCVVCKGLEEAPPDDTSANTATDQVEAGNASTQEEAGEYDPDMMVVDEVSSAGEEDTKRRRSKKSDKAERKKTLTAKKKNGGERMKRPTSARDKAKRISRADLEIMLSHPVRTPSRKLRSRA